MTDSMPDEVMTGFQVIPGERAILAFMGYPGGAKKSPFLESRLALIRALKARYESLIEPNGVFRLFHFKTKQGKITLEGSDTELESTFLAQKFGESGIIGLFVVTIGCALEEKAAALMKENRGLESLALEAIASESVEQAAHYMQRHIQKRLNRRLVRYSPGYDEHRGKNDWSLTEQKIVFSLLRPERIGVRLSESCMMMPRKSVSAIVGERRGRLPLHIQ